MGIGIQGMMNDPTEILIPDNEKIIQMACGNAFSIGLTIPLRSADSLKRDAIDKMIGIDGVSTITYIQDSLESELYPNQFTFGTNERQKYQNT